jgi:starvation-inducible DNA-binding protein
MLPGRYDFSRSGPLAGSGQAADRSQRRTIMVTTANIAGDTNGRTTGRITAQPRLHQKAAEIQRYGTVTPMLPLDLEEPVRLEMTEQLNQVVADTMTLRDLYKKSHWQVAGPTFYQLHLLFNKHHDKQAALVDAIAERITRAMK